MRAVGKAWRTLATGFCFLLFTLGSALLSWCILPVFRLLPSRGEARRRRVRLVIQRYFGLMVFLIHRLGCMRLRVLGAQGLHDSAGKLILANHPTLIDVVVLLSLVPQAGCVVKGGLFDSASVGPVLRSAGYIENRGGVELVEGCSAALRAAQPVFIFPEGTRTTPGTSLVFQRGTAHVLLATRADFIPVLISCEPPTLLKGDPWHRIPDRRFELVVTVLEPVPAAAWEPRVAGLPRAMAARELTRFLEVYFMERLSPRP